jgi:hypothetical protein
MKTLQCSEKAEKQEMGTVKEIKANGRHLDGRFEGRQGKT